MLINLSDIITWISKRSFLGGNALVLVALVPLISGGLLCLGLAIITKKEEQYTLAAHERMKKEHPSDYSGEKELRDISALIEATNRSLHRIKNSSQEILSMTKTIAQARQNLGIKQPSPPTPLPLKTLLCTDKFLEMPVSPEALTMAIEKINQTEEQQVYETNNDTYKNPISEREVLFTLLNRLKIEQDFHIFR
jgi:hypothetical protein